MSFSASVSAMAGRCQYSRLSLSPKDVYGLLEMGGLKEAVSKAGKLAKVEKYETIYYPEKKPWYEKLLEDAKGGNNLDEQLQSTLGVYYEPFKMVKNIQNQNPIQARMPVLISVE